MRRNLGERGYGSLDLRELRGDTAAGGVAVKRFLLYLLRWQLSTPILAVVVAYFAYLGKWWAAAIANLIGGCIFFWVDKWIFREKGR
jgi:hypothetical protein